MQSKRSKTLQLLITFVLFLFIDEAHSYLMVQKTQGVSWKGYVQQRSCTKRVTINPYFLDIEEDIELTPYTSSWSAPTDNLTTMEIFGKFYLPTQSVITGVLIWDGENILEGKLKGKEAARTQYEDVVDRNTSPPPRPRDPIIIEKISNGNEVDEYNLAIYPVTWGKNRKIRIRYLCPHKYLNGELQFSIPSVLIDECFPVINAISLEISGSKGIENFTLGPYYDTVYNLPYKANLNATFFQSNGSLQIKLKNQAEEMCVKTSFDDGLWKGNYVMYWGKPPDSLFINSGLRREVLFLWKWNFLHTFVYNDNTGKRLSAYGQEAISQAQQISSAAQDIADAGDKVGLLLDQGNPQANKFYTLGKKNTPLFDSLKTFLAGIDSSYFLTKLDGVEAPAKIRISENERAAFFKSNAESFDISLKLICSVFSKNEKVIKHIVLISAGPVPEMPNLEDYYMKSDTLLQNKISISAYGTSPRYPTGYWPGIPIYKVVEKHALIDSGTTVNGFWIPSKKDASFIKMVIGNSTKSYEKTMQITTCEYSYSYQNGDYDSVCNTTAADTTFFAGHSFSSWNDQIDWEAYDKIGNKLGSYKHIPLVFNTPQDTFAVKLWAGTTNPVAEGGYESNRGARFGIVDAQYSLLALGTDTLTSAEKLNIIEKGLPFLSDNDIFLSDALNTPVKQNGMVTNHAQSLSIIRMSNGIFKITLLKGMVINAIKVYDLKGRLLYSFSKQELSNKCEVFWNPQNKISKGSYKLVISTSIGNIVKSFIIF